MIKKPKILRLKNPYDRRPLASNPIKAGMTMKGRLIAGMDAEGPIVNTDTGLVLRSDLYGDFYVDMFSALHILSDPPLDKQATE